ncbi:MAG: hypothetical protein R3D55_03430 [Chloroflexota bacterium]
MSSAIAAGAGHAHKFGLLRTNPDFLVLDTPQIELRRTESGRFLIILCAVLITATFGWLSISTTMVLGAVLWSSAAC